MRAVLVGHPNVGKSVLFNALTGKYVTVSNYPGTTVDVAQGTGRVRGHLVEFVDSPGIYSLVSHSEEEKVTRSLLLQSPGVLIQVADAKNLARTLSLTFELSELNIPMVLCLNMMDEADSWGYRIDAERLSEILGIPVVKTVATTQEGLEELRKSLFQAAPPKWKNSYPPEVQRAIRNLQAELPDKLRFISALLLQNHTPPEDFPLLPPQISGRIAHCLENIRRRFLRPLPAIFIESRREQAALVLAEVLTSPAAPFSVPAGRGLQVLGQWCLRPWPGYLIAVLALWALYEFVGVLGAQIAVDFLENTVFGGTVNPVLTRAVHLLVPWPFLRDMLIGDYGVFTMALTYAFALILPIVTTFFLALGFLEDTGYLPRLSVLLNRAFKIIGLNGKAVLPMILGVGCGTMALLTTRILDTKKERILASFLLALAVPCSAQLGVIFAMTAGLSGSVFALWLFVVVATFLGAGWVSSKLLPGAPAPFLMEIPPMRLPQMKNLLTKVASRLKWYVWEVVPLFIYGTLALYFLDALGWLGAVERFCAPLITGLLGLPEKATEAFLVGFLRRDYGAAGLYQLQRQGLLSLRQSAVSLVAITLFMPCIAQWFMSVKERGLKVTLAISGLVIFYALLVSAGVNQILLALGWS